MEQSHLCKVKSFSVEKLPACAEPIVHCCVHNTLRVEPAVTQKTALFNILHVSCKTDVNIILSSMARYPIWFSFYSDFLSGVLYAVFIPSISARDHTQLMFLILSP